MEKYLPEIKGKPVIEKIGLPCPMEELFGHFADEPEAAFLNSSMETDAGRYSFVGLDPFLSLRGKGRDLELRFNGHKHLLKADPFDCLGSIMDTYRASNPSPLPFTSGGIGYLSYDLKNIVERLPRKAEDDLALPDIYFVFYRTVLAHDNHDPGHLYVCNIDTDTRLGGAMDEFSRKIRGVAPGGHKTRLASASCRPKLISNTSREDYIISIKKVLDYIRAGDIYQACLSQRFRSEWTERPYELYLRLNEINPAPFSAFLNYDDFSVISSSPELLLDIRDGVIETRPMKGTRPRGANADEDRSMMERLRTSAKDASELSMIVDLERNDLGKVSVPGSVKVAEHRRMETYPTVFQTISIVKSEKEKDSGLADVIKAVFPGGSISGCPKIRAMEIIDELEPNVRSVYTGSIGYMSFHDTMELNIAIRTMVMKDKNVYFHAGGGIVADSDPETEYEETLHKAKAMIEALGCGG